MGLYGNQLLEVGTNSIRRQDLFCLLLYYLGFSRIRNLVQRFRRIPVIRILAFHDVSQEQVHSFRIKLEYIKEVANVISIDDILSRQLTWEKINVAITFDDGNRGWIDHVYPVLKDLGLNATFFVSSGLIGLSKEEELDFLRNKLRSNRQALGSLNPEELKRLALEGFTIGGHTYNHCDLSELVDYNELCSEIQKDKRELERITGTEVANFAYPFGFFRNANIDLAKVLHASGYRAAVTLVPGFNTADTNSYFLHRDLVNPSMPLSVFRARLEGNYDGVIFVRKLLGI